MVTAEEKFYAFLTGSKARAPSAPIENRALEKEIEVTPDSGTPVSLRNLFTHHDAHPVVLNFALSKEFGQDWLGWEFDTIFSEVSRVFKTQLSELARAKIRTVKTINSVDTPWISWQVFEKIVQGLNNNIPNWELMQAPSLEQLYVAIDTMAMFKDVPFSDEVRLYMASAVLHEDVFFVPPPLDFIQMEVSQPKVECLDCGNTDSALFHDGVCDTCAKKFLHDKGLSGASNPEETAKGIGKNVKFYLTYDPTEVQIKWDEVKESSFDSIKLEETQTNIQIAKLLIARDYMNLRRKQLAEQLNALKDWMGSK